MKALKEGDFFGEHALITNKPRLANVSSIDFSVLAVLTKSDYTKILGVIEHKKMSEKIHFFKQLPQFASLTRTSLGKLSYYITDIHMIKD